MSNIDRLGRGVLHATAALLALCHSAPVAAQDLDLSPALRGHVVEDAALFGPLDGLTFMLRREGDYTITAKKVAAYLPSKSVHKLKSAWSMSRYLPGIRLGILVGNARRQKETLEEQQFAPVNSSSSKPVTKTFLVIHNKNAGMSNSFGVSMAPLTRKATVRSVRQDDAGVLHLKLHSPQTPAALAKAVKPLFGAVTMKRQNGANAPGGGAFTARKTVGAVHGRGFRVARAAAEQTGGGRPNVDDLPALPH